MIYGVLVPNIIIYIALCVFLFALLIFLCIQLCGHHASNQIPDTSYHRFFEKEVIQSLEENQLLGL